MTYTDEELIAEYEQDCKDRNLAPESTRRYAENVRIFKRFLDTRNEGLLDINKDTLRDFIRLLRHKQGHKVASLEHTFSSLNGFYNFLLYEELIEKNIIGPFRERYLSKYKDEVVERQVPDVEVMGRFINSIPKIRDKAVALLFAKTGIRRNELITLDLRDIDWDEMSITLKSTRKRSNKTVYFDAECSRVLKSWLQLRESLHPQVDALFVGEDGTRLKRRGVYDSTIKWATAFGLHHPEADSIKDKFSCHAFRHWFTTTLIRAGMRREYVQELRGDADSAAIDIYNHIDKKELRQAYLAAMPELGII